MEYHSKAIQFFHLFDDPVRWQLLTALARTHEHIDALVHITGEPHDVVQQYLTQLQELELVTIREGDVDNRGVYYSLNHDRMRALYLAAGASVHPALIAPEVVQPPFMAIRVRVLFLCTHNSARSQIAEGLLRHYSQGRIDVWSAGSTPTQVHPRAIEVLAEAGIDIRHHRSDHLNTYLTERFDYVVTVCDELREICPSFPGNPQHLHWSFPDPTRQLPSSMQEQRLIFRQTMTHIATMVRYFLYFIDYERRQRFQF